MGVEIDPKTLEITSAASARAFEQAIVHIREEIRARDPENLEALMGSLAPGGPYAYTILPEVRQDGTVKLPVLTTREEIAGAYAFIRGLSDLHEVIALKEICGTWYTFQEAISRGSAKGSDQLNNRHTLAIFPSGTEKGITGELVWLRVPRSQLGAPDEGDAISEDPMLARWQVSDQHARFLHALRGNDLDGLLDTVHDGAASAVRDYVDDTGTLVELTGKEEHRRWYGAFLDKYEVRSVQSLCQVTEDWYVFFELRIVAVPRRVERTVGVERTVAFHTAEFHVPAKDGRFIARIGHGTEPA